MRKCIVYFLIFILASCATPQTGDGIKGKIDVTTKNLTKAKIFFRYSSNQGTYNFAPKVIIQNNSFKDSFVIGDLKTVIKEVNSGKLVITVYPPLEKIRNYQVNPYWKSGDPFGLKQEKKKIESN